MRVPPIRLHCFAVRGGVVYFTFAGSLGGNTTRAVAIATASATTFRAPAHTEHPSNNHAPAPFILVCIAVALAPLVLSQKQKQSPAVLAKLCACSGALIAEMPYATMVPRGESTTGDPGRTGDNGGGGGSGGRAGVEESLGDLLRALARLAMDVASEPSARIAGASFAAAAARRSHRLVSAARISMLWWYRQQRHRGFCTTAYRCRFVENRNHGASLT